jgi:hypothetical protein
MLSAKGLGLRRNAVLKVRPGPPMEKGQGQFSDNPEASG